MAKKAKTIEIKSVPTEPQRGAGEGADPSDPVTILYPRGTGEQLIGSLAGGDEDEAVIKTGGCIVPGDITVRYESSGSGPQYLNMTYTDDGVVSYGGLMNCGSTFVKDANDHLCTNYGGTRDIEAGSYYYMPFYRTDDNKYLVAFYIYDDNHDFVVTVNGVTLAYAEGVHAYEYESLTYPGDIAIVVSAATPK